jgi:hypothetical protein
MPLLQSVSGEASQYRNPTSGSVKTEEPLLSRVNTFVQISKVRSGSRTLIKAGVDQNAAREGRRPARCGALHQIASRRAQLICPTGRFGKMLSSPSRKNISLYEL